MFSGIGGFELGIQRATNNKWECVGYSEINKYAIQTYKKYYPDYTNYGDARNIDANKLPDFDFLCGGYPCQCFSIAGKRKGFADTRGTMFFEIERIAREKQPKIILLENVKGLLSHNAGNTFKIIMQHLNSLGYLVDFRILNSKYFGVPQNRERIFHIGYNLKWLIKENVENGLIMRNSLLDKMLKGYLLENLLKDLEELKNLPEIKLKEWILNYLKYICGNQTRLEYLKTIKNSQINNSLNSSIELQQQLHINEKNADFALREKEKNLKMVQDIYELMMEKETDYTFIDLWQKSILENLIERKESTTLILIKKIMEKTIFSCAEINLIIGWFILLEKDYWENWLKMELLDLIKLRGFMKDEGRRNKTKLGERCLLRNIRTTMGFTEPTSKSNMFIIGNLGGTPKPEILPFRTTTANDFEERGIEQVNQPNHAGYRYYSAEGISPNLRARARSDWHSSPKICMNTLTEALGTRQGSSKEFVNSVQKIKATTNHIRRLTPVECERLQSFPDGWTEGVSDTQRYKQLGNAVTTNVITAIIQKLSEEFKNES